jgi:hypothetical protein
MQLPGWVGGWEKCRQEPLNWNSCSRLPWGDGGGVAGSSSSAVTDDINSQPTVPSPPKMLLQYD